jgi:hypothetical protein
MLPERFATLETSNVYASSTAVLIGPERICESSSNVSCNGWQRGTSYSIPSDDDVMMMA